MEAFLDDVAQWDGFAGVVLIADQAQHALDHHCGTVAMLDGFGQGFTHEGDVVLVVQRQFTIIDHGGQDVVEFVGNDGDDRSQRSHFLGGVDLLFETLDPKFIILQLPV